MKPLDLSKYEGHKEGPWHWSDDGPYSDDLLGSKKGREFEEVLSTCGCCGGIEAAEPDRALTADAPALLAELKAWRELGEEIVDADVYCPSCRSMTKPYGGDGCDEDCALAALLPETKEKEA